MRRLLLLAVAVVLVGAAALSAVAAPGLGSSGAERRPGVVTRLWGYDNGEYGGVYGLALNDRGDAIWNWRDSPQFGKGFVWRQGRTTQLAEGVADINRRGQVVVGGVLWENGKSTVLLQGADKSPVLRSLHPYNVVAVAINDRGQVVGAVEGSNPDRKTSWQHPFLWENDTMIDLGTLGGTGAGYANAINERAQVVGDMRMLRSESVWEQEPFIWENGKMRALTVPGWPKWYPSEITESGLVVGATSDGKDLLWNQGKMTNLSTLGGNRSDATSINKHGQVVGWYDTSHSPRHAFLWQNGKLRDLGTLGGHRSQAFALNDRGQVVGRSQLPNGSWHAFLWQHGKMTDLGSFRPRAINNNGQILALNNTCRQRTCQLLLWTPKT